MRRPDDPEDPAEPERRSGGSGSYYYGGGKSGDGKVQGGSFDKSAVDRGGFGCTKSGGG